MGGSAWSWLFLFIQVLAASVAAEAQSKIVHTSETISKLGIDVRDYNVKGDGITDDTAALDSAISALPNYGTLLFPPPPNCRMKITSTVTFLQKIGIKIEMPQEADLGYACGLYWFGTQGGTMVYLNQVHGSEWHNFSVICSGGYTGYPSTRGCNTGILLDEPTNPTYITTNNAFLDISVNNAVPNASFIGVDIGPNAPGNVENNYFYNAKVACGGPTLDHTDTGFRLGGSHGSQPNNTQISHGGPLSCGRGFWIRGNTNGVDIGNMALAQNYNTLYIAGGDNIHYHDIVDQISSQPIAITGAGIGPHLMLDNYNTSGTVIGPEMSVGGGVTLYLTLTNSKFSNGITTLSIGKGSQVPLWEFNSTFTDPTFCNVIADSRQFDTYSETCRLYPIGFKERSNGVGCPESGYGQLWPDVKTDRWKMCGGNSGATTVAGFSDTLGVFAAGGTISPAFYASHTNCSANGTASNPSVVSCSAAPAGAFSCAINASRGTCTINTTAVTANSDIVITPSAADSARLGVTCNSTADRPSAPRLASKVAGIGFTINVGIVETKPICYEYIIFN